MWQILRYYGIPQKIVTAIKSLYDSSECIVKVGDTFSDKFSVTTGVLQGDTLAPFIFIIVMDSTQTYSRRSWFCDSTNTYAKSQ